MNLLIFVLIVLVVVALIIWLIDLVPLPHPLNLICKVAAVLIAIILIVQKAGIV